MNPRTLLLFSLLPVAASSQTWLAQTSDASKDSLGSVLLLVDDLDGDGVADVVSRDTLETNGPLSFNVRFFAGDDLAPLLTVAGASYEQLGVDLTSLGDVNGDGVPEIAASARFDAPPNHQGKQPGKVRVLSGADGSVVHQIEGTTPTMGLGTNLGNAGDIDGDGLQDLIASTQEPGPTTRIYSTGTWQPIESFPGFGLALSPGDIDLDGVPDIAVVQPEDGTIPIFSGATGRVLIVIAKAAQGFGASVAAMGDLDDDGVPDIAVGAPNNGGSARTISCATGADLVVTWGWQPTGDYGRSVSSAGDVDGDGHADLLVGAPNMDATLTTTFGAGVVLVRSSATGDILARFEGKANQHFGPVVVGGRDLQGDGFPDFAVGIPGTGSASTSTLHTASARLRVTQMLPTEVVWSQPTLVEAHGAGFDPALPVQVTVGGLPATSATCVSPSLVQFTTPVGIEDTAADVAITQDGLSVVLVKGLNLVGPEILDVYPPVIPKVGGTVVSVTGTHFAVDGTAIVNFHAGPGAIQSISETGVVAVAPAFTPGAPWDVQVTGSTGSGTSPFLAFKYSDKFASPNRGNIAGGTTVILSGLEANHVLGTPTVLIAGLPCQVLAVSKTQMTIVTPSIAEPDGFASDFFISDPVKGNEIVTARFTYTPWLKATWTKHVLSGGRIRLQWITSPAATQPQLVTTWFGVPNSSTFDMSFPAFAGVLHVAPWTFVSFLQPIPQPGQIMDFTVPPYDPLAIGMTLRVQSHVTGEGFAKGSFTNAATITLN